MQLTSSYSWVPRLAAIVDYRGQTFDEEDGEIHPYFMIGHGEYEEEIEGRTFYLWAWIDGKLDVRGPIDGGTYETHGTYWGHDRTDLTYKGRYDLEKNKVSLVVPSRWEHRPVPSSLMSRLEQRFPGAEISIF